MYNPHRKQTKTWTTKEGAKVRICDMADGHLRNAIAMLERSLREIQCTTSPPSFNGEMAQYYADQDYDRLMEATPDDLWPIYGNLIEEQSRREWKEG